MRILRILLVHVAHCGHDRDTWGLSRYTASTPKVCHNYTSRVYHGYNVYRELRLYNGHISVSLSQDRPLHAHIRPYRAVMVHYGTDTHPREPSRGTQTITIEIDRLATSIWVQQQAQCVWTCVIYLEREGAAVRAPWSVCRLQLLYEAICIQFSGWWERRVRTASTRAGIPWCHR